jgi:hypothetical protein
MKERGVGEEEGRRGRGRVTGKVRGRGRGERGEEGEMRERGEEGENQEKLGLFLLSLGVFLLSRC